MALHSVTNWKSKGTRATAERKAHFEALANLLSVPGAEVNLGNIVDTSFRSANLHVDYPGKHQAALASVLRPFVLLEVGSARVTPFVARDMTSFVHEHLESLRQLGDFDDNCPRAVRCVHPLVTLRLEQRAQVVHRLQRVGMAVAQDAAADFELALGEFLGFRVLSFAVESLDLLIRPHERRQIRAFRVREATHTTQIGHTAPRINDLMPLHRSVFAPRAPARRVRTLVLEPQFHDARRQPERLVERGAASLLRLRDEPLLLEFLDPRLEPGHFFSHALRQHRTLDPQRPQLLRQPRRVGCPLG